MPSKRARCMRPSDQKTDVSKQPCNKCLISVSRTPSSRAGATLWSAPAPLSQVRASVPCPHSTVRYPQLRPPSLTSHDPLSSGPSPVPHQPSHYPQVCPPSPFKWPPYLAVPRPMLSPLPQPARPSPPSPVLPPAPPQPQTQSLPTPAAAGKPTQPASLGRQAQAEPRRGYGPSAPSTCPSPV